MSYEIEKKFLVKLNDWKNLPVLQKYVLGQFYFLDNNVQKRLRINLTNQKAYVTQKSESSIINGALVRDEKEFEIRMDSDEFKNILKNITSDTPILFKTRTLITYYDFILEIDEFHNLNAPYKDLTLCEIEFKNTEEVKKFHPPYWLGQDVSKNFEFANTNLIKYSTHDSKRNKFQM